MNSRIFTKSILNNQNVFYLSMEIKNDLPEKGVDDANILV